MPKFVLVDHSLKNLGGHHYPYAYSVLQAAQRCGWQPVLAVNRAFSERAALPQSWRVHALYAHESYSRYTLDTQAQVAQDGSAAPDRRWRALRALWQQRARGRRVTDFARDCAILFELEPLAQGDLVFFATTSELDLAGLTAFLGRTRAGADALWHLQFHFGVFHGREPDYAAQAAAAAAMRASLAQSVRQSGPQRLHFYCTTEQLTGQYQQLGVAQFATLPYPVHELFRPRATKAPAPAHALPLRIACLGHSRREKGYAQLPQVLRALWRDWFGPGRAQLVLQTHRGGQRQRLEKLVAELAAGSAASAPALDFAGFPLPLAAYAELLCGVDIGLLLYDPTRYYARCSGVLLEMLCAGVPVLVPAGGWLAAQIETENQNHLDRVTARSDAPRPLAPDGIMAIPAASDSVLIACKWRAQAGAGEYLRLQLDAQHAGAETIATAVAIVGKRGAGLPVRALFRLPPGCRHARLATRNAWHPGAAPVAALSWSALSESVPLGALGLTVAESSEVPRLLQDLLQHFDHYRREVRAHAAACAAAHSGVQVLAGLGAASGAQIAAACANT